MNLFPQATSFDSWIYRKGMNNHYFIGICKNISTAHFYIFQAELYLL